MQHITPSFQPRHLLFSSCCAFVLGFVLCLVTPRHSFSQNKKQASITAITGATIYTMTQSKPFVGTILLKGKTIKAVGPEVKIPSNAKVVRGKGMIVTPGLTIADTSLGLIEVGQIHRTRNTSMNIKSSLRPAFRVGSGIDPHNTRIPITRVEGVTSVMVRPSGGLIPGQSALIDLTGQLHNTIVESGLALHAAISSGWKGSSAFAWLRLRQLLMESRYRAQQPTGFPRYLHNHPIHLDATRRVRARRKPWVFHVNKAMHILNALRFAKQQKLSKVVLCGAAEAWQVIPQLKAHPGVSLILGPPRGLPFNFGTIGNRMDNAARLYKAGIPFVFGAEGASMNVRNIRHDAGRAVAHGLPYQAALRALTSNFYEIFKRHPHDKRAPRGKLTPGAVANIVLWTGDPLELSTHAKQVWIQGQAIPMRSRQTMLRDRYRTIPFPKESPKSLTYQP